MMKKLVITQEDMIRAGIDFDNFEVNESLLNEIEEESNRTEMACYFDDFIRDINN